MSNGPFDNTMLVISLIQNIALLVALTVVHDLLTRRLPGSDRVRRATSGLLFGLVAIIGMMTPMNFSPGIIYDGRSIILAVAGTFTGTSGGTIAAVVAVTYRIYLGGAGMIPGVLTIVAATAVGIGFYYLRKRSDRWTRWYWLVAVGIVVHVAMLAAQLLLPGHAGWTVISTIGPIVIVVFTGGFVLIAQLFIESENKAAAEQRVRQSEARYRSLFENHHTVMFVMDPETGRLVDANPAAAAYYGYTRHQFRKMTVMDLNSFPPEEVRDRSIEARTHQTNTFEFKHRLADGTLRDVEVHSGPVTVDGHAYLFSMVVDITARVEAEKGLERSLHEKDVLLKEIHHRVKNNLAIVAALVNLQSDQVSGEAEAIQALGKTRDRILAMGQIHSLLYQSETLAEIDFAAYLRSLVQRLADTYAGNTSVEVEVDTEIVRLEVTTAVPLGLMINEIVTNAFKHAFPDGREGRIVISLEDGRESGYRISIADNGVGMEPPAPDEVPTSLGLKLVHILAKQIDPTVRVRPGDGTSWEIEIPT